MNVSILSRSPRSYSTRRLYEAAHKRGHKVKVHDTLKFYMVSQQEEPELYYRHRRVGHVDAVIPRIGASITFFGLAVLRQFEQMGVYAANESVAIARSRDKLRATQVLSRHDIGIPPTAFVRDKEEVLEAIERVGGTPVIIKLLEGTQGVGVILADTVKIAQAIIETLQSAKQNVLIQKFVAESRGTDIRVLVVGDKIVASMRRTAQEGEFRSNVHRGGKTSSVALDEEYQRTAIRAAQIMGLHIAGVDMLEGADGPQVMEINSSPGLEGIETITGVDVAGAIIEDIENKVLFPEVDLRQRLRLAAGFGVAEFTVHDMPDLEEKALRDTSLTDRNIQVLSISRQDALVPNPKGDSIIHAGDKLLCYGDLHELRVMMPEKKKPKRKPKGKKSAG